ncbi:MAG: EamA family transporter, partial [Candidatus Berkelbacteria bacterium]
AAIFGGSADVFNKILLGKMKMGTKNYLPIIFVMLAFISLFLIPLNFYFSVEALSWKLILILILMIVSAGAWNVLLAKSLETEPLHEYEVIILMSPLVTVILAAIFLPIERNLVTFIAGIVSSIALVLSRFRKHHFVVSKTAKQTMLAVVLIGVEAVCLKILLNYYSPTLLYFIRVTILAIVYLVYYKPDFSLLKKFDLTKIMILTALMGTGVMVLKYYAFQKIGLVLTTIILLIAPIITYLASYFYFKEKKNFGRDAICAIVISICIITSLILNS